MSVLLVWACASKATLPVSGGQAKDHVDTDNTQTEIDELPQVEQRNETIQSENPAVITELSEEPQESPIPEIVPVVERDPDVDFTTIGCVLPMSGRSRLVGETVLKGVMLGAGALAAHDGVKLNVIVRDSMSDPDVASEAVEQLVEKKRVAAIVGPMDGDAAKAAARRAEELGVPLMLFSTRSGLVEGQRFAFRQFATNRSEVSALAHATARLGNSKVAVFFPTSGYGRAMGDLMKEESSRAGLEFVGAFPYDPKSSSFLEASSELSKVEFDTLFVPDAASRIALLAPALASAGLWSTPTGMESEGTGRAIQLLIPSAGLAKDLPRRAGRYLSGALFTSFLSSESSPGTADFIERFELEYGAAPNFLSGYGYDAVVLLTAAIRAGALNREGISDWLQGVSADETNSLPLAMPFEGFSSEGEPMAKPWVLQLIGSEFVALR